MHWQLTHPKSTILKSDPPTFLHLSPPDSSIPPWRPIHQPKSLLLSIAWTIFHHFDNVILRHRGQWPLPRQSARTCPRPALEGWCGQHVTCVQAHGDRAPTGGPRGRPSVSPVSTRASDSCHRLAAIPRWATVRRCDGPGWCCRTPYSGLWSATDGDRVFIV